MISSICFFRKHFIIITITTIIFITPLFTNGQDIAINEVMASNSKDSVAIADEDGDYPDWIELYNYGTGPINLEGFGLSDDYDNPYRWVFPSITLQPGEYLLIWASNKDRKPEVTEYTDGILRQVYKGIPGHRIEDLLNHRDFSDNPDEEYLVTDYFEAPTNIDDHYGQRMHGYIKAPYTGNYKFWIASDDNGSLRLSTNDIPGNAVEIANVPEWTSSREWDKFPEQESDYIFLEEGNYYYICALMKEHEGGDNLAVRWELPDGNIEEPIPAENIYWRNKEFHTNFAISSAGEEVILTNPSGDLVDELEPTNIPTNISYGRYPNGTGNWFYYTNPTPGEPNHDEGFTEIMKPPAFSHSGGFYENPFELHIFNSGPEAKIYYTLDGSIPDPDNVGGQTYNYKNDYPGGQMLTQEYESHEYSNNITITNRSGEPDKFSQMATTFRQDYYPSEPIFKGTAIRARTFKEGTVPSETTSHTYFVTPQLYSHYTLPVISINTQEDGLFDYDNGIYVPGKILEETGVWYPNGGTNANYHQRGREWERRASLEFFEPNAKYPTFKQDIGIRIHGGWSRAHSIKSLRLYARGVYGESRFNHQIFPGQPYNEYNRLMLRNSGNDYAYSMFRDAAMQAVMKGLSFDTQAYRPAIVFINSEYWGIHNIRERYDKHYLSRVHGADPDSIDLLEHRNTVKEGSSRHYDDMLNYIESNDITQNDHYQHIKTQMDVNNFIEYQISNIFLANTDWPQNNIDFWRYNTSEYEPDAPGQLDGRWRWLLYDTDFGFSLYGENYTDNTLYWATRANEWSTLLLRSLIDNESFRNDFINRFADLLNTNFLPENIKPIIDEMRETLEPEIDDHIHRWNRPWGKGHWEDEINSMIEFAENRSHYQRQHIKNKFGINGEFNITINVSDHNKGHVRINKLDIKEDTHGVPEDPYPWTGIYFRDIPVEFEAIPKPGYHFVKWEGLEEKTKPLTNQIFTSENVSITAIFDEAELIHYWHFNDLGDDDEIRMVYADQTLIGDAFIAYPGTGGGYMDRVDDGTSLNAVSNTGNGYGLRVRNPSDKHNLLFNIPTTGYQNITMSYATKRTPNGQQSQTLYYRTGPQKNWIKYDGTTTMTEDYKLSKYNFTDPIVNDNPYFMVKIVFGGYGISGTSGNNRFDNIRVEGTEKYTTTSSQKKYNNYPDPDPNIYHNNEELYIYNPYPENVIVEVYDTHGIAIQTFNVPEKGLYNFHFNPQQGVYIARLIHEKQTFSSKFLVSE